MRYFVKYFNSEIIAVGIGNGGTEITKSEYNTFLSMIHEKAALVDKLYSGEITISEVPSDWQEEIQRKVNERKVWEEENAVSDEATTEDYINALTEVGVI